MRTAPSSVARDRRDDGGIQPQDLTLGCLRSLGAQRVPGVTVDVFVLDDGSSDGTSEAIAEQFPEVTVLHGDGELYWSGGMRQAFAAAIAGDYDHYLWLNDDVYLDDGALVVLLDTARQLHQRGEVVIVVGSTRDPQTGQLTYGGVVHPHRWRPLRSELVEPGDAPRPCDTMNGQVVLIPAPWCNASGTSTRRSCNRWVTSTTGFAPGRPAARSGLPRAQLPAVLPIRSTAPTSSP
jgi:GT2 family glycosyltransferase